jgi:hypothetical protein
MASRQLADKKYSYLLTKKIHSMHVRFSKTILLFSVMCLLLSCHKNDTPVVVDTMPDLSLDSLQVITSNIPTAVYTDLAFISPTIGFAVTINSIVKTTDAGHSWTSITPPVNAGLTKIQFTDATIGYILGGNNFDPVLLKTTDGGNTWVRINLPAPGSVEGLHFIDNNKGFITGSNLFIKTVDGGQTWVDVKTGVNRVYNNVEFRNAKEGTVTTSDGVYFITRDGGRSWDSLHLTDNNPLFDIYYIGSKILAVKSSDTLVDLADHFAVTKKPTAVNKLLFISASKCIGIGSHVDSGFWPNGDIFITNDGWAHYQQKTYKLAESIGFTAISKMTDDKIMILGMGFSGTSVIILKR